CEKPMAMNVVEAREMTELAKEKRVLALIDHELRFVNGRQKAYKMLRNGDIGKVIHAKYHFCNASRGDKNLPWSWWSDEKQGGGALGAIGSHVIDTFRWFLDTEISEIFCKLHTHIKQRPDAKTGEMREVSTDDETLMILRFSDGNLTEDATASVSLSVVEAGNYRNAVEFFGTKGALRIEDNGEIFFAEIKESSWKQIEVELGNIAPGMRESGWSRGFMNFSREIVSALLAEKSEIPHGATFEDGAMIQKVLDAARESSDTGCLIKL
ncbi:MAG TPA: Gfo/Idh/MocA family oxidoreductase, partial [Pyrinomonadaceae bacterium]|nr:Gfo/Idh/MocA family oxidoreductase [Pyrinomonadaceae bacterium]